MPLEQVSPSQGFTQTINRIQRQGVPRFRTEQERDQQYTNPAPGALCAVGPTVFRYDGARWRLPDPGPSAINQFQDVNALDPPDGAVLTWSAAAQAWGWSMP